MTRQTAEQCLLTLSTDQLLSRAIYTAIHLELARHLGGEMVSSEQLAERMGANAGATHSLLSLLANRGLLEESSNGTFRATLLTRYLDRRCEASFCDALLALQDERWDESCNFIAPQSPIASEEATLVWAMGTQFLHAKALIYSAHYSIAEEIARNNDNDEKLARATGLSEEGIKSMMDALLAWGVFSSQNGTYQLTALSDAMRGAMRFPLQLEYGCRWDALKAMQQVVMRGEDAFQLTKNMRYYQWLESDPKAAQLFQDAMTALTKHEIAYIAETVSVRQGEEIVEVGGGNGALIEALLTRHDQVGGVLFDLPEVITALEPSSHQLGGRLKCIGGSFFDKVPNGTLLLMKRCLHNWSDDEAVLILKKMREALTPTAAVTKPTVLLCELMIPGHGRPHLAYDVGLLLRTFFGGRGRTLAEYQELGQRAGLQPVATAEQGSYLTLLELTSENEGIDFNPQL